jgi:putative membrane protein
VLHVEESAMDDPASGKAKDLKEGSAALRRTAKAVEESAGKLTAETGQLIDGSDRRTELAGDRTLLAAERTYAAWVRTALAALATGVGARALVRDILPSWVGKLTGTVLILFAGFCLVAAVWRELQGAERARAPDVKPIPRALLVPMNFFLLIVAIAAMIGIWSS